MSKLQNSNKKWSRVQKLQAKGDRPVSQKNVFGQKLPRGIRETVDRMPAVPWELAPRSYL
jgi:hypothetical protein